MSVTIKKKTISPAMAKAALDSRGPNRNIAPMRVQSLLRQMQEGKFMDLGDTIRFNCSGVLLDGQHRYSALVEFGKPMEFWIAEGIEADALPAMDTGKPRTPGDTLAIYGQMKGRDWSKTNAMAGTLRLLMSYEDSGGEMMRGGATGGGDIVITRFDLVRSAERYKDIGKSLDIGAAVSKTLKTGCSIFAALHYLFHRIDGDSADAFMRSLVTNEYEGRNDNAKVLRDQIVAFGLSGRKMGTMEVAYRVIRAWNANRNGQVMAKIQLPRDTTRLRLPEIE